MDDKILVIEFQSTEVDDEFSKRGLIYVSIVNAKKDSDKPVILLVLSTVENTKTVEYKFGENSLFKYDVAGFEKYDVEKIINNIKIKVDNSEVIDSVEIITFTMTPLMDKKHAEKRLDEVIPLLLKIIQPSNSIKDLSYGITWLMSTNS